MCMSPAEGSYITTPSNKTPRRDGVPVDRPKAINAQDVPLGEGLADSAKRAILTRRERLRIAEEG